MPDIEIQSATLAMFGLALCIIGALMAAANVGKEITNVQEALAGEDVEPAGNMGLGCLIAVVVIVLILLLSGLIVVPGIAVVK